MKSWLCKTAILENLLDTQKFWWDKNYRWYRRVTLNLLELSVFYIHELVEYFSIL